MMKIERVEATETVIKELLEFLIPMASEVALAPLNKDKVLKQIYLTVDFGQTFVAQDDDGKIIGSIGLIEMPLWYADETFLVDQWFYVAPDARFGDVGVKLLRTVRDLAEPLGKMVFVTIANPSRRQPRTTAGVYAIIAGLVPLAHLTKIR